MTRARPAARALAAALAVACGPAASDDPAPADPARPPNLLVILLDDWGVDRFDGQPTQPDTSARTPVLDAFAASNLLFTRAYADPVCSPSRAAALTGRLGIETGVTTGFQWFSRNTDDFVLEPDAHPSLPAELRRLGYATFAVGKWHLTSQLWEPDPYMHPIAMGFDRHVGLISNLVEKQGVSYTSYELNRADADGAVQEEVVDGTYLTTRQVDDALALIRAAGDQPWFTWLALTAPHAPWHAPPQELVSVDVLTLAPNDTPALYDAVLEAADTEIGRLLDSLDPATRARTVILVVGDNGTPGDVFPRFAERAGKKGFTTEGGTHVPLIVSAPGLEPGTSDQLVHVVDLFPTLLELAGGEAGDVMRGDGSPGADTPPALDVWPALGASGSFAPRLRGDDSAPTRTWVYSARRKPIGFPEAPFEMERAGLRTDQWRIILQAGADEPPRHELRFLGDALWGEGEPVEEPTDASRAAWLELSALLDAVEAR